MMQNIIEIQNEILEEFEDFSDWEEKYSYIIELGSDLPEMADSLKISENIVKGCQSQVWLVPEYNKETNLLKFIADSDAFIVKGLVSILLRIFSNQTPQEILSNELFIFEKLGLKGHLSPSRANGLSSMLRYIKNYAEQYIKN
ncbi:MAG: SufE family protein [Candidatus Sericytochromatia bacterium]